MKKTLPQHFEDYLGFCAHTKVLRPATLKSYQDVFSLFRTLMPDVVYPEQLDRDVMDEFFVRLRHRHRRVGKGFVQGVKPSTTRTYGSKLHSFFEWLCVRDVLDSNPIAWDALAKPNYDDRRALDRAQVDQIIAAIVQNAPNRFLLKRNLALIKLFLFAGLRKTEMLSLRLGDIDLAGRTVTVSGATSKSKVTRYLPLSPEALVSLEDYLAERRAARKRCEFLWVSAHRDRRFTAHGLKHLIERLNEQSGVDFHAHRFRHTYACMLGRNDVSAVKIQKLLGHTDLRMTQTYLRSLGVEDLRDSVRFLSLENLSPDCRRE